MSLSPFAALAPILLCVFRLAPTRFHRRMNTKQWYQCKFQRERSCAEHSPHFHISIDKHLLFGCEEAMNKNRFRNEFIVFRGGSWEKARETVEGRRDDGNFEPSHTLKPLIHWIEDFMLLELISNLKTNPSARLLRNKGGMPRKTEGDVTSG